MSTPEKSKKKKAQDPAPKKKRIRKLDQDEQNRHYEDFWPTMGAFHFFHDNQNR